MTGQLRDGGGRCPTVEPGCRGGSDELLGGKPPGGGGGTKGIQNDEGLGGNPAGGGDGGGRSLKLTDRGGSAAVLGGRCGSSRRR